MGLSRVRARAHPANLHFLLSQPSQYRPKSTSKTAISNVSSFLPKSAFFPPFPALKHHSFTNSVPITLISSSSTASYDRFCEGCESKKVEIPVTYARHTRVRKTPNKGVQNWNKSDLPFHPTWLVPHPLNPNRSLDRNSASQN